MMPKPKGMDGPCIRLCKALNGLPGIMTVSSCSGHGQDSFSVFFRADSIKSLYPVTRLLDVRYGCPSMNWRCEVVDTDLFETDPVVFVVTSGLLVGKSAYRQANIIAKNIEEFMDSWYPEFGDRIMSKAR